jgi:chromosome segregation ATPase
MDVSDAGRAAQLKRHYALEPAAPMLWRRDHNAIHYPPRSSSSDSRGTVGKPADYRNPTGRDGLIPVRGPPNGGSGDQHAMTTVTALQFAGLTMQLEIERTKREDADRLLREEATVQFAEMREAIRGLNRENSSLREWIAEIRRSTVRGGIDPLQQQGPNSFLASMSRADNVSHNAGSRHPTSGGTGLAPRGASLHNDFAMETLSNRVEELEVLGARHQRIIDDRHTRLENAVSEFCSAHIATEMERLRSTARETARGSVDELLKERVETLTASWADAYGELQQQVTQLSQRTRDAVAAVNERVAASDTQLTSVATQLDQQKDAMRGVLDARAFVTTVNTLRNDFDRHAAQFRERTQDWNAAEAKLQSDVRGLRDHLAELKADVTTSVSKRIETLSSNSVSKSDVMAAIDRAGSGLDIQIRALEDSVNAVKTSIDNLRNTTDTRIKAAEATAKASAERVSVIDEAHSSAHRQLMGQLDERINAAAARQPWKEALLDVETRLTQRVAAAEVVLRPLDNTLAMIRSDAAESASQVDAAVGALRARVDAAEQAANSARRLVAELRADVDNKDGSTAHVQALLESEREQRLRQDNRITEVRQKIDAVETQCSTRIHEITTFTHSLLPAATAKAREAADNSVAAMRPELLATAADVAREHAEAAVKNHPSVTSAVQERSIARSAPSLGDDQQMRHLAEMVATKICREEVQRLRVSTGEDLEHQRTALATQLDDLQQEVRKVRKDVTADTTRQTTDIARTSAANFDAVSAELAVLKTQVDGLTRAASSSSSTAVSEGIRRYVADALEAQRSEADATCKERGEATENSVQSSIKRLASAVAKLTDKVEAMGRAWEKAEDDDDDPHDGATAAAEGHSREMDGSGSTSFTSIRDVVARVTRKSEDTMQAQLRSLRQAAASAKAEADSAKQEVQDVHATVDDLTAQLSTNGQQVQSLRDQFRTLSSDLRTLSAATSSAPAEAAATQPRSAPLSDADLESVKGELAAVKGNQATLKEQIATLKSNAANAVTRAEIDDQLRTLEAKIIAPAAAVPRAEPTADTATMVAVNDKIESLQLDVDVHRAKLEQLSHDIAVVSANASSAAADGASQAVERLRTEFTSFVRNASPGRESSRQSGAPSTVDSVWRDEVDGWRQSTDEDIDDARRAITDTRDLLRLTDGRVAEHSDFIRALDGRLIAVEDQLADAIEDLAAAIVAQARELGPLPTPNPDVPLGLEQFQHGNEVTLKTAVNTLWSVVGGVNVKADALKVGLDNSARMLMDAVMELSAVGHRFGIRFSWDPEDSDDLDIGSGDGDDGDDGNERRPAPVSRDPPPARGSDPIRRHQQQQQRQQPQALNPTGSGRGEIDPIASGSSTASSTRPAPRR